MQAFCFLSWDLVDCARLKTKDQNHNMRFMDQVDGGGTVALGVLSGRRWVGCLVV